MFVLKVNSHQVLSFIKHFFSAKRRGHGIHSPFAYQLCEEFFYNSNSYYDFEELKKIRKELLQNNQRLQIEDFGAGSKIFKNHQRKIKDIASNGISSSLQSELIYRLLNFLNCRTSIELGTSLGLNTLYLSKSTKTARVISIEASEQLVAFASELAKKNNVNSIEFIHSTFENALATILESINTLDFIYIDGNHTYEATLKYFELALTKKNNSSVFVFDDSYWSKGMTKAWQQIKEHPEVTLSIDAFYFGMIFFKKEIKEKTDLKIYL